MTKDTLDLLYGLLMRVQISPSTENFEDTCRVLVQAKSELEAALAEFEDK